MKLTLPVDSQERKDVPVAGGCRNYFPAALVGVARWSKLGNDKHNPGQPLHHARGKSMDHEECIERHSMDLADLQAAYDRTVDPNERAALVKAMLDEYDARSWRSLAASQEFREKHGLAPLAPGARLPVEVPGQQHMSVRYGGYSTPARMPIGHGNLDASKDYHGVLGLGPVVPTLSSIDKALDADVRETKSVEAMQRRVAEVDADGGATLRNRFTQD